MARDDLFFERLAEVHPRFRTPAAAVAVQGVWASILALVGSYEKLLSFTQFAAWIFYGMTVAAVIIQRRRMPSTPRPYRMWGYPITPALFVVAAVALVVNTLVTQPGPAFAGLGLIGTGIPVYLYWSRRKRSVNKSHPRPERSLPQAPSRLG
jgi:APA family basic amino acid/polyamine antiporter